MVGGGPCSGGDVFSFIRIFGFRHFHGRKNERRSVVNILDDTKGYIYFFFLLLVLL